MHYNKLLLALLPCFFLHGCLGKAWLGEGDETQDVYGPLRSVPDRPDTPDLDQLAAQRQELEKLHQKILEKKET